MYVLVFMMNTKKIRCYLLFRPTLFKKSKQISNSFLFKCLFSLMVFKKSNILKKYAEINYITMIICDTMELPYIFCRLCNNTVYFSHYAR